jgi:dihydropyrimidine dehydrogenase (NAD+) subunit PreA
MPDKSRSSFDIVFHGCYRSPNMLNYRCPRAEEMADLTTEFCGIRVKNPIGVTSCDFGGSERLVRRCAEQGIGWIIGKTVHKIDGPDRWPRPYFYSLRRFGKDLKDAWICSQMFHNKPYEVWLEQELPNCLRACEEHALLFIGSCSGIGADPDTWIPLLKDMEAAGVRLIELDTGGPHATFGAVDAHKAVGAPLALDPETAHRVTKACAQAVDIPLIFKMTPQCVNMAGVALAVERAGAAAISANNAFYGTWIDHETGTFYGVPASVGGLMGRPWQLFSLAKILEITKTVKIPVIGGGGSFTYDDCVRYLMAGCTLAGMCSSIYSRGVNVLREAVDGLSDFMDRKNYRSVQDFQGCVVDQFIYLRDWKRESPMAELTPVVPRFDDGRCTRCSICEKVCPYGAIMLDSEAGTLPYIKRRLCQGCGWCVGHCPTDAIEMVMAETGDLVWNGHGTMSEWVK